MTHIKVFTCNPFSENTYLIYDENKNAVLIDPGFYSEHEQNEFKEFVRLNSIKITCVLNTHAHIDHILGNYFIYHEYGLKTRIHEQELPIINELSPASAKMYGIHYQAAPYDQNFLIEGETIRVGDICLEVMFTPGHAPGHVVFVEHHQKFIINGDVLFKGSIGRTDFPYCSYEQLEKSIKQKLYTLPEEYVVYTGHGDSTTIGYEKLNNPFVQG